MGCSSYTDPTCYAITCRADVYGVWISDTGSQKHSGQYLLKNTHREKAQSNKTPALRRSTNMGVWTVGTLNLFEVLKLKQNFQKTKAVTGKTQFSVIGPFYLS